MRTTLRTAAAISLAALTLSACSSTSSGDEPDKVIRIGAAIGLTGDAAVGDVPALAGMRYQVEKINKAGGIAGYTFEIVAKDMKSDAALGGTVTQELLDDGVDVVVGPAFPGMASGVAEVASSAGVPVLAGVSTQPEYLALGAEGSIFLVAFGDNVQAAGVAEYLLKNGAKSAYTVSSPDMSYTMKTPQYFADTFVHGGGTHVGDTTYSIGQTDFSAQVTKIAALDPQPDVIFTTMFPPDTPSFIRALRRAGVQTPVAGGDGFDIDELLQAGGDALVGTVFSTHVFPTPGSEFTAFKEGPAADDADMASAPALAALGASNVQVVAAAVEKAKSADPAAIRDALASLKDVATLTGAITYEGTNGIPLKPVTIGGVENGAFVYQDSLIPAFIPEP